MKIGVLLYPTYGGSGVVATELGKIMAQKGHEVHFITYDVPVRLGALRHNIYYHEVRVSDYPLFHYTPYELVLTSKIVDVAINEKLDVLHVHYAIPHASAAYKAQQILKERGIYLPYITTLHGTDITLVGRDKSFEPVISFAINKSDAVTAVSESLKNDTYKYFNIDRDIEVVHNFIDVKTKGLGRINRDEYALPNEKIISHISNFRKVKRIADIIEIFYKIRQKVPSKLIMAGDGPERNAAQVKCRELKICDDVYFLGNIRSTYELLSISDLFLLPSETESFGLSALEAMAYKTPVISSNSGGLSEVNESGFSGYTADVGDIDKMANYAIDMLSDEEKLNQFKENALTHALKFNANDISQQYIEIYEKVLKQKGNIN